MNDMMVQRQTLYPINWRGVPMSLHGKVSAVCRSQAECEDLIHWYGDAEFCPVLPVLLMVPNHPCLVLMGVGVTTASELRDDAVALWVQKSERLAKTGSVMDFDSLREKHNLMRREDVAAASSEAFWDRIKAHRASPVTDPFRQMTYPNPTAKTVHAVAEDQDWKEQND